MVLPLLPIAANGDLSFFGLLVLAAKRSDLPRVCPYSLPFHRPIPVTAGRQKKRIAHDGGEGSTHVAVEYTHHTRTSCFADKLVRGETTYIGEL